MDSEVKESAAGILNDEIRFEIKNTDIYKALKKHWGYTSFRPMQEDIVQSVLNGDDTLVILPTGAGKSMCYQLPAAVLPGTCVVISPLIALMEDQQRQLRKRGISAAAIHSGLSYKRIKRIIEYAQQGQLKMLYIAPERLNSEYFREALSHIPVSFVAIDEAHCISQWGLDFRPSYREIQRLREDFPELQFVALTASATQRVQQDIEDNLGLRDVRHFRGGTKRDNLSYAVIQTENKFEALRVQLAQSQRISIVYTQSRAATEKISFYLRESGIQADYYHAGMDSKQRSDTLRRFLKGQIKVVVSTSAFGMGIDKADIENVIHWNPPLSLEEYYQEAGRAGRDGKRASARLLLDEAAVPRLMRRYEQSYPEFHEMRRIWQSLKKYCHENGLDRYGVVQNFDLKEFAALVDRSVRFCYHFLGHMQRYGFLKYNQEEWKRSEVRFCCSKEDLYEYTSTKFQDDELIKTLLRSYENLFFRFAEIDESKIAQKMDLSQAEVVQGLRRLRHDGILLYKTATASTALHLLRSMPITRENFQDYAILKNRKKEQLKSLLEYLETGRCRSLFIQEYFNDHDTSLCGICDNCTGQVKESKVIDILRRNKELSLNDLFNSFPASQRQAIKKCIAQELEQGHIQIIQDRIINRIDV